jgi:hypothetical protein
MSALSRRGFLSGSTAATAASFAEGLRGEKSSKQSDREYWVAVLIRIAEPVLTALAQRKLRASMPVETLHGNAEERSQYTHLEALGRLLAGMSAWLESGERAGAAGELRRRYADLARRAIAAAVDPSSPDYMNFAKGSQPLVDAAFLALAVLRAPTELWEKVDSETKQKLVEALRSTRVIRPGFNNWLLFSATIEAFFCRVGEQWDAMRIDYAIRQHEEWYKGDGIYGDGPQFHWDYYNSFVIHPMLLEVVESMGLISSGNCGSRTAVCGDTGAAHQPGRKLSGDRPVARVPVWSFPLAGVDGAAAAIARRYCAGASALRVKRDNPPND